LKNILLVISFFSIFSIHVLYAGRESEYSDRYPKFTEIIKHDSSLYFAGSWTNRYIVVERERNGTWHTYSCQGDKYYLAATSIFSVTDGLLFMCGNGGYKKFLFQTKKWETTTYEIIRPFYKSQYSNQQNEIRKIQSPDNLEQFEFPLPSYNTLCRWRFFPNSLNHINASIGPNITRHNTIWFTINFYDGEGSTGIGGLGLFDLDKRIFGVIRDKFLASCSGGLLTNRGDTIIIATNQSCEYGTYGDNGLVLIDIKKGLLSNIPCAQNTLNGDYFLAMKIIDDVLWITSDRSIISWYFNSNSWNSYRIESLVINNNCNVYRKPKRYSDFSNGGLPNHIDYDSSIAVSRYIKGDTVVCEWPGDDYAEIQCKENIYGWISKDKYASFSKRTKEERAISYPDEILYTDSTLKIPFHSFRSSTISLERQNADAVMIAVNTGWIRMDDVDPILSESSRGSTPQLRWHSVLNSAIDIKQEAFLTLGTEQQEIRSKIPILDTTLTICNTMDLYNNFENIIDVRWLPSGSFDKNSCPKGIKLNYDTEFWIRNNRVEYNGKLISVGDTIHAEAGDAVYTYTILGYSINDSIENCLKELKLKYTVVMIPK